MLFWMCFGFVRNLFCAVFQPPDKLSQLCAQSLAK